MSYLALNIMKTVIAIDLGATSGRVVLASYGGLKVTAEILHRFRTPLREKDGMYFWDIFLLREEIIAGLRRAAGRKIDSIGIDSWGVDFCTVSEDGNLTFPRAYRDPYTDGIPEQFFRRMPRAELYARTGIQTMNFNSVFQLFAQQAAGMLSHAGKILFIPDALSYLLTGKMVCEYTILSTSALMDPVAKEFDPSILRLCGLRRDQFPDIVMPGTIVGMLDERIGLGPIPVMAVAGHDTASAVAAVPAEDTHFAYLSSGTWSLMGIETPEPVINATTAELNYTNEGGASGNIRLLKNITGMWLLEQCLAQWRKEGRDYTYREIDALAIRQAPAPTLIDPDDPDFTAPQNMPAAISCKLGRSLSDGEIVRLIYDSLAAKYAQVLEGLKMLSPADIHILHIIGGGSRNELLNQMTADACKIKVVAGPAEGAALGNVMVQMGLSRSDILHSVEMKTYHPHA